MLVRDSKRRELEAAGVRGVIDREAWRSAVGVFDRQKGAVVGAVKEEDGAFFGEFGGVPLFVGGEAREFGEVEANLRIAIEVLFEDLFVAGDGGREGWWSGPIENGLFVESPLMSL